MRNNNAFPVRLVTGLAIAAGALGVSSCAEVDPNFTYTKGYGNNSFDASWGPSPKGSFHAECDENGELVGEFNSDLPGSGDQHLDLGPQDDDICDNGEVNRGEFDFLESY